MRAITEVRNIASKLNVLAQDPNNKSMHEEIKNFIKTVGEDLKTHSDNKTQQTLSSKVKHAVTHVRETVKQQVTRRGEHKETTEQAKVLNDKVSNLFKK